MGFLPEHGALPESLWDFYLRHMASTWVIMGFLPKAWDIYLGHHGISTWCIGQLPESSWDFYLRHSTSTYGITGFLPERMGFLKSWHDSYLRRSRSYVSLPEWQLWRNLRCDFKFLWKKKYRYRFEGCLLKSTKTLTDEFDMKSAVAAPLFPHVMAVLIYTTVKKSHYYFRLALDPLRTQPIQPDTHTTR